MLSICIPVYNFDVNQLVKRLHQQCELAQIDFEILCFDDGSNLGYKRKNRGINTLPQVNYIELPENLGRSRIRNELGKAAQYPFLIFMDCDSAIVSELYITNYLKHCTPHKVLYGGRVYYSDPPSDPHCYFHWFYGKNREESTAEQRAVNPYHGFMTNNFLIPKSIFLSIQFDESLTQYGHEDTIFGLELQQRAIDIQHMDNPLAHIGIEETGVFIKKTKKAIQNLWYLSLKYDLMETKLLHVYQRCRTLGIVPILRWMGGFLQKNIEKSLHGKHPKLFAFDVLKLIYLIQVADEKNRISHRHDLSTRN